VLVIDEFASLVAELPDFVTGLVSIAQRGRSLGIHLVLATQRPSGVVSPEIRANTNLRIALRVTDDMESKDVIDAGDAARIPRPRRAAGTRAPATPRCCRSRPAASAVPGRVAPAPSSGPRRWPGRCRGRWSASRRRCGRRPAAARRPTRVTPTCPTW
jgi:S-DNA-T family DNA segregation ATPase FtsK/SpoIIIE